MSTVIAPSPTPPQSQRRFTVAEYHKLIEVGVITKRDRCELIRGYIVRKPLLNPPHATALSKLLTQLFALIGTGAILRSQQPIELADSEPEPDFTIAVGNLDDYDTRHPNPDDIQFVVEISDSSLLEDQTTQLALYAENRIPEYWIVNLKDRRVEVHTQPRRGKTPSYRQRREYGPDDTIPVTIGGTVVGSIPVREILPK